ncbi:DUF805 domain-containing protein [Sphingomonas lenta]|uniref:DUF805 domain-containing protein n=1 Tax=Sphingomonas lenta TaxID=1141887 RepID=A0A2A2SKH9_9SPHN|nr:DUF805 domain-containing protein [Sphingomonas lenta]PAX09756.1 DUF805 domain-containing protein [Sphingomonas lenta]
MILPYRRYAEFSGRSRRKEYWMFLLFTIIVNIALTATQGVLGLSLGGGDGVGALAAIGGIGLLSLIFGLGSLIPSIAVAMRRLHDTNRSGWWLLAPVLPYILGVLVMVGGLFGAASGAGANSAAAGAGAGLILTSIGLILGLVLLVFFCIEGTRGPNRFGPDPKDPSGTADLNEVFR